MALRTSPAAALCIAVILGLTGCGGGPDEPTVQRSRPALTGVIAFVHRDRAQSPDGQIWLARADGTGAHPLVHSAADDEDPWLSPDGRQLAFTRRTAGQPDRIFVVDVTGSELRSLTASGCPDVCSDAADGPGWSPDGRTLAFTRAVVRGTKPITIEIWLVDVAAGTARRLTTGSTARVGDRLRSQDGYPSWSPDGARVLYVHEEHATPAGLDQFTVMSVAKDGTEPRSITPNDVNGGQPTWAPDGTLIAFQSPPDKEGVTRALYTIRPDGTGMTSLTNTLDPNDSFHPTWSPDSRYVAFSHVPAGTSSSGNADVYVVGRDGSDPHPITVTRADETAPSWAISG